MPITAEAKNGFKIGSIKSNFTNLLTINMAKMEELVTIRYPAAAPFTPNLLAKRGITIHERIVQIIMNPNVTFILPVAFNTFVNWVVTDDRIVPPEMINSGVKAGSHFSYRGTISTRSGAKTIRPKTDGNTKKQMKKIDLETLL